MIGKEIIVLEDDYWESLEYCNNGGSSSIKYRDESRGEEIIFLPAEK